MDERVHYWSMLKGIAILTVIMIHIPLTTNEGAFTAVRQLENFPVAMFFFLSGYFVKKNGDYWKDIKRPLYPYLIWSIVWCIITPPHSVEKFIIKLLTGNFSILYFLFVLVQLKCLTPWLQRRVNQAGYRWTKDPLLILTPLWLSIMTAIRIYTGNEHGVGYMSHFFPAWLIFYQIGMICKGHSVKLQPAYLVLGILCSLFVGTIVAFWCIDSVENEKLVYTQSKLSSMVYSLCLILLFYKTYDGKMPRNLLSRIGEMSFGIYILHMVVKNMGSQLVELLQLGHLREYCYPPFKYIIVLIATIALLLICKRIFPLRLQRIFGLQ